MTHLPSDSSSDDPEEAPGAGASAGDEHVDEAPGVTRTALGALWAMLPRPPTEHNELPPDPQR